MGLDNSIDIKRNEYTNNIPELKRFEDEWIRKCQSDFSVTYWRKNWGLRNDIIFILGDRWNNSYKFELTKDDVENIIELLKSYNSDNWKNSIWDWDDEEWPYSEYVQQNIEDLKLLRELMNKYDLEVYFYDSY